MCVYTNNHWISALFPSKNHHPATCKTATPNRPSPPSNFSSKPTWTYPVRVLGPVSSDWAEALCRQKKNYLKIALFFSDFLFLKKQDFPARERWTLCDTTRNIIFQMDSFCFGAYVVSLLWLNSINLRLRRQDANAFFLPVSSVFFVSNFSP